jgi:hypothetical protein
MGAPAGHQRNLAMHDLVLPWNVHQSADRGVLAMKIAVTGWEPCKVEWWLDTVDDLIRGGLPWSDGSCLMDLAFWQGQIRLGRRSKIPTSRTLAKRWKRTRYATQGLLRRADEWKDFHIDQNQPKHQPDIDQSSAKFRSKTKEECEAVDHFSSTFRPEVDQKPAQVRNTKTKAKTTNTIPASAQAGLAGINLLDISGNSRDRLWPELVSDLISAGYQTLEEVAAAGRHNLATDLGSAASRKRLDKVQRVIEVHGLTSQPASQSPPGLKSFETSDSLSLVERYALPTTAPTGPAPWDSVDYSGDRNGK